MGFCESSNDRLSPHLGFFEHLMPPLELGHFLIDCMLNDPYRAALSIFVFLLTIPLKIVIGRPFFQDFAK